MTDWAVGVDIGGTNIRVAAVDAHGTVLAMVSEAVDWSATAPAEFGQVVSLIDSARRRGPGDPVGVGIGCTGPIDRRSGVVDNPFTLPAALNGHLVDAVAAAVDLPVALENDADVAALAEARYGAGRDCDVVVCVTFGTGIGVGVVRSAEIVRGRDGSHPEAGHQVIDPSGPVCYCGAHGCWESLASATAIVRGYADLTTGDPVTTALDVQHAADDGDDVARVVIERARVASAIGVRNLVAMYAPKAVVVTGNAVGHAARLVASMQVAVDAFALGPPGGVLIATSPLAGRGGCVGAAALVLP